MDIQIPDKDVAQAHCCGAGGGQYFLDSGRPMAKQRANELSAHNPQHVLTACPFCTEMLSNEIQAQDTKNGIPQNITPENAIEQILPGITYRFP